MPLKCSFKARFPRVYMFFGTRSPNLWSFLTPEVELMVLLRMRSDKITKNAENVLKILFRGLMFRMYMFFGAGNPNMRSILKPEVESMVFRRRADAAEKNVKNAGKCRVNKVVMPNFSRVYVLRHG